MVFDKLTLSPPGAQSIAVTERYGTRAHAGVPDQNGSASGAGLLAYLKGFLPAGREASEDNGEVFSRGSSSPPSKRTVGVRGTALTPEGVVAWSEPCRLR